jgi:hypothetical protein
LLVQRQLGSSPSACRSSPMIFSGVNRCGLHS